MPCLLACTRHLNNFHKTHAHGKSCTHAQNHMQSTVLNCGKLCIQRHGWQAAFFICCTWRDMRIAARLDLPVLGEENPLSSWQYKLLWRRRFDFAIILWATGLWFCCTRNAHAYPNRTVQTRKKTSRSDHRIVDKHATMSGSGWSPYAYHLALLRPLLKEKTQTAPKKTRNVWNPRGFCDLEIRRKKNTSIRDYFEYRRRTYSVTITHSPITLAKFSSINLVFIFRCSSSPRNPVYSSRVDSSTLVFSLSSYRHSLVGLVFRSRFIDS